MYIYGQPPPSVLFHSGLEQHFVENAHIFVYIEKQFHKAEIGNPTSDESYCRTGIGRQTSDQSLYKTGIGDRRSNIGSRFLQDRDRRLEMRHWIE